MGSSRLGEECARHKEDLCTLQYQMSVKFRESYIIGDTEPEIPNRRETRLSNTCTFVEIEGLLHELGPFHAVSLGDHRIKHVHLSVTCRYIALVIDNDMSLIDNLGVIFIGLRERTERQPQLIVQCQLSIPHE